jgi:GNAT superfamily N-acetyltransferase
VIDAKNAIEARKIRKAEWPRYDCDYSDTIAKTSPCNLSWIVRWNNSTPIGIAGITNRRQGCKHSLWLDWFTIVPQFRGKGIGKAVLLDMFEYCKKLGSCKFLRLDTLYNPKRVSSAMYDKIFDLREAYTAEDTSISKLDYFIFTKYLSADKEPWGERNINLRKEYGLADDYNGLLLEDY